jgi:hypothetical protein
MVLYSGCVLAEALGVSHAILSAVPMQKPRIKVGLLLVIIISGCLGIWLWHIGVRLVAVLLMAGCVLQIYDQIAEAYNDDPKRRSGE